MEIKEFSSLAQIIICGFAGMVLSLFWWHLKSFGRRLKDDGFIILGSALLAWALLGALELTILGGDAETVTLADVLVRRILSIANSCLFLLSLPYFEHGFEKVKERFSLFRDPGKWKSWVLMGAGIAFISTLFLFWLYQGNGNILINSQERKIITTPDMVFSFLAILALSYGMFMSFWARKVASLSFLTVLALVCLAFVQVLDLGDNAYEKPFYLLMRLCSHSILVMLFFSLAFSWLAERINDNEELGEIKKFVEGEKMIRFGVNHLGKLFIVLTWGEKQLVEEKIFLSEGRFKYLLLCAVRRINDAYVHADRDVINLFGGKIDTSNHAIKAELNKHLLPEFAISNRGEMIESAGQGSKQYRLNFSPEDIRFDLEDLQEVKSLHSILSELN